MAIDILNIKPHEVTTDLSGLPILIYGAPKVGKTTMACDFPKPLLMAFEKGYNMIDGIMAQPINSWGEALEVHRQLIADAKKVELGQQEEAMFKTIIIDTLDIAWNMCGKFIAAQDGKTFVDDIGYGKGVNHQSLTFIDLPMELCKANYTVVMIAHEAIENIETKTGQMVRKVRPDLHPKARSVCNMVDIFGYATIEYDSEGKSHPVLIMRDDGFIEAGSHNPYMSAKIPLTYDALLKDVQQATKKLAKAKGKKAKSTPNVSPYKEQNDMSFDEVMDKIAAIVKEMYEAGEMDKYQEIVDRNLGQGKLVKECTKAQIDILRVIYAELEALRQEKIA